MSKIENGSSDLGQAVHPLQDDDLDTVTGGVQGDCIRDGIGGPRVTYNPWLTLGSLERRLIFIGSPSPV